jgi:hypothetical protein
MVGFAVRRGFIRAVPILCRIVGLRRRARIYPRRQPKCATTVDPNAGIVTPGSSLIDATRCGANVVIDCQRWSAASWDGGADLSAPYDAIGMPAHHRARTYQHVFRARGSAVDGILGWQRG